MTLPAQIEAVLMKHGITYTVIVPEGAVGRMVGVEKHLVSPTLVADLAALLAPRPDRAALEDILGRFGVIPTQLLGATEHHARLREALMTWATTPPTEEPTWCEHIYQVPVYDQPGQYNWSLKKEPRSMDVQVFDDWIVCPLCGQPRPGGAG